MSHLQHITVLTGNITKAMNLWRCTHLTSGFPDNSCSFIRLFRASRQNMRKRLESDTCSATISSNANVFSFVGFFHQHSLAAAANQIID